MPLYVSVKTAGNVKDLMASMSLTLIFFHLLAGDLAPIPPLLPVSFAGFNARLSLGYAPPICPSGFGLWAYFPQSNLKLTRRLFWDIRPDMQ
jgi:hypothetical protein